MHYKVFVLFGLLATALGATVRTRGPVNTTPGGTTRLTRFPPAPSTQEASTKSPVVTAKPTVTSKPVITTTAAPPKNVLEAIKQAGATQFHDILEVSDIKNVLEQNGPFTVFAPSNKAFQNFDEITLIRILADSARRHQFLSFHCAFGSVYSAQIGNDVTVNTLSGAKLRLNIYNLNGTVVVTADGTKVVNVDNVAPNGVVHIVDEVIYPQPSGDIVETLAGARGFGRISSLLQLSPFAEELRKGPYTFFAPSNEAIANLQPEEVAIIIANPELLTDFLKYHTVAGTYHYVGLDTSSRLKSLTNETVDIEVADDVKTVNGAIIQQEAIISATNGVIHGIASIMESPENIIRYIKRTMTKH